MCIEGAQPTTQGGDAQGAPFPRSLPHLAEGLAHA
jgi:hypothetical protein